MARRDVGPRDRPRTSADRPHISPLVAFRKRGDYLLAPWSSCTWVVPGEWSGSAHGPGEHGRKHDDWRNIGPCDPAGPGTGMGGVESESWLAPFPVLESSAPRFVGIAVSTNLFSDHEGELFHLNCTLRVSSTMTRLDLNRNARASRALAWLTTPLWAGKSSANAAASLRGQHEIRGSIHIHIHIHTIGLEDSQHQRLH